MLKTITTGGLAALALTAPALAADSYTVDPQHAWVAFETSHAGWTTAHGLFSGITGSITWDKDEVTNSAVEVTIDTTTISSGFEDRDKDMRSPDFFNTLEFPTASFKSTAVEQTGENTGTITGDLTIIGVTREVTLDAVFNQEIALPWDPSTFKAGFSATGSIQPADFGMTKFTEFGLGPDVTLEIDVEATKD